MDRLHLPLPTVATSFLATMSSRLAIVLPVKWIGINTNRVKLVGLAIAGTAAVAGIPATARVGSACSRGRQGAGLELQAIAACVIGGSCCAADEARSSASSSASSSSTRSPTCFRRRCAPGFYLDMFIATLIVLAAIIFNHLIERRGLA